MSSGTATLPEPVAQGTPQTEAAGSQPKADMPESVGDLREMLADMEIQLSNDLGPVPEDLEEFYHMATLSDGWECPMKIVRPKSVSDGTGVPLILLFHGGGFAAGTRNQLTRPSRDFAQEFNVVVISADYKLAPQAPFPQGINSAWNVVTWACEHAGETFGADPSQGFIVGGFSAGGHLASVLATLAVERGLPNDIPLTGSFLSIPSTAVTVDVIPEKYRHLYKSLVEGTDDPMLGKAGIDMIVKNLRPDFQSPLFSAFNASSETRRELPKTYFQAGGRDPLRDDAVVYEQLLRDEGVQTRIDVHETCAHDAFTIWFNEKSPPELKTKTMDGVAWLLGRA